MAERHPGWVNGIDSFEARLAGGFAVVSESKSDALDPIRVRSGIKDTSGMPGLVSMSGNTKVLVNAFQGVITNAAKPGEGPYVVTLDAIKELTLDAASQSLRRIDLICAEINTTSPAGFEVKVLKGTDSATPVKPAVANPLTMVLAEITIPSVTDGTAPSVLDTRRFTGVPSGILPVRSAQDRPPVAPLSMFLYRLDTGVLEVQKSGVGWVPYRAPAADVWNPPALQNGWVDYGNGYAPAGYTRNSDGWVLLRGLIRFGNTADFTKLFTLPAGYRPQWIVLNACAAANAKTIRVDVLPSGVVQLASKGDTVGGVIENHWLSLDGITFATY
jgi:hypothetical protein